MEDFVPFEIAKKLAEKGFDLKTRCGYLPPMKRVLESFTDKDWTKSNGYSAPTISQVFKWLREAKRIDAGAVWDNRDGKWIGYINEMDMPDLVGEYVLPNTYDAYEQAALSVIGDVLDNLI